MTNQETLIYGLGLLAWASAGMAVLSMIGGVSGYKAAMARHDPERFHHFQQVAPGVVAFFTVALCIVTVLLWPAFLVGEIRERRQGKQGSDAS
ncbi:hypothetical protein [Streptomyces bobili]|uniref:hypothetical protein n=1 Tax=Streptomyces bobili TaxID=67280 RepID=UPI00381C28CF